MSDMLQGAEAGVIGSIMVNPGVMDEVAGDLSPTHFQHAPLRRIYAQAMKLWEHGEEFTAVDVASLLQEGDEAIAQACYDTTPLSAHARAYAAQVRKDADRRSLVSVAVGIRDGVQDNSMSPSQVAEEAAAALHMMTTGGDESFVTIGEGIADFVTDLERRARAGESPGIPSPFPGLDSKIGGFEKSLYYVLGARPAVGKSALAKQIAAKAVSSGRKALICILESSKEAWLRRIVSGATGISTMDLKIGNVRDGDWPRIIEATNGIAKQGDSLTIWDAPAITPARVHAECLRLKRTRGLDMLIVDYIQLMSTGIKSYSRTDEIRYISQQLKDLGKLLGIPVIVLAQLGRQVQQESGNMRRPMLTDLKESGSLEQDADVVMFLHRETVLRDDTELLIAKQKDGPIGKVHLTFDRKAVKFTEEMTSAERALA